MLGKYRGTDPLILVSNYLHEIGTYRCSNNISLILHNDTLYRNQASLQIRLQKKHLPRLLHLYKYNRSQFRPVWVQYQTLLAYLVLQKIQRD
ncbi:Uncharacterised protein [Salmonella enterica subsp. enterica serovar Bovismorbificans]|uniref:Uncharacterized protein n=1 Tax=Salmonella enterica subsp. enterica serovar Bovismorbificans TaxID=58097 RepID=A0A655EFS1_SALET|nr:Uncharacterised protein [Salmonella enterica subsp. enterica serovar Bovismorbificans]CNV17088.1 Uncharacterised protein [Salmonella enterica subsp. enterica serovar Bovismorbificans]CPR42853.1 Uncharacterised protein [Salmonella enterica subsp. enterica serovar Bovismorbificans]